MKRRDEWWDCPVWVMDLGFDQTFNDVILEEAYEIASDMRSGVDKNPQNSLWDYSKPNLDVLKNAVLDIVKTKIIKEVGSAKGLNLSCEYTTGWMNVIEPNDGIEVHAHNDCSLVMTYYLKAPKGSGDFVYLNTQNLINGGGEFQLSNVSLERITPKEGMLILFPSYLMHEVTDNKSNDLRISLSADIKQIVDTDAPNAMVFKNWCDSLLKIKEWAP